MIKRVSRLSPGALVTLFFLLCLLPLLAMGFKIFIFAQGRNNHLISNQDIVDIRNVIFGLSVLLLLIIAIALFLFHSVLKERGSAETKSLESTAELEAVIDTALSAVITINEKGQITGWSTNSERLLGWTKTEVMGKTLGETIIPARYKASHEWGMKNFLATGEGPILDKIVEMTALHKNGNEFPVEINLSPPVAKANNQFTFVALLKDLTGRKGEERLQSVKIAAAEAIAEALSLNDATTLVLKGIGDAMGWCVGLFWMLDWSSHKLTRKGFWHASGLEVDDLEIVTSRAAITSGEEVLGKAWATSSLQIVDDLKEYDSAVWHGEALKAGMKTCFAFPILNGNSVTGVLQFLSSSNKALPDELLNTLMLDVGSQIGQFVERKRTEDALKDSGEKIRAVLENVGDGIITLDERGAVDSVNPAAQELFGYTPNELIGARLDILVAEQARTQFISDLQEFTRLSKRTGREIQARETLGKRQEGTIFSMEFFVRDMVVGQQRLFIVTLRDITDRKAQTDKLEFQALHDSLTGLPNRTFLDKRLRASIKQANKTQGHVALMIMDMNKFKEVNDTLRHHNGDLLLQKIAEKVQKTLRDTDTVARLGGDEFAVLLTGISDSKDAIIVAKKILTALEPPVVLNDHVLNVRLSIGLALYPENGEDAETLMKRADVAMYVAKRSRAGYAIYHSEQDEFSAARLTLMTEMKTAISNSLQLLENPQLTEEKVVENRLMLHYQPIFDLRQRRTTGVEALVRWQHPRNKLMMPVEFIAEVEDSDLIGPFTTWVIGEALAQVERWKNKNLNLSVSVNLSAGNLHDPNLVASIQKGFALRNLEPKHLHLEITESTIMSAGADEILLELKKLGMELAIDDFGTGYSSLAYLKRLPVHELKIDRSFILDIGASSEDARSEEHT